MHPKSLNANSVELVRRLEQVMDRLGFTNSAGLVREWPEYTALTNRHIVRQALEKIRVNAVFGFPSGSSDVIRRYSPIAYFAIAHDHDEANSIHRLVWSQGVVPILLIATPAGLEIRKSLTPPSTVPITVPWFRLTSSHALPTELTSLTAISLTSSLVWNDFAIGGKSRVDNVLLDAIVQLNKEVQNRFPLLAKRADLVNSVIARFIYLFVLLDRGVITSSWVRGLKSNNEDQLLCAQIAKSILDNGEIDPIDEKWPKHEIWSLFDQIDEFLNGTIFPISVRDRLAIPESALHYIRRVIRHSDQLSDNSRQLGFLNISFKTLRTETISAIYELFLKIESPSDKRDLGVFYTPPFLVDYILDEIDQIEPFTADCKILDPAAGSGIFLVGVYRRILERTILTTLSTIDHLKEAKSILQNNIFWYRARCQGRKRCAVQFVPHSIRLC